MDAESVHDCRVERVENRRPSDVFLALWRERTISCSPTVDEFSALADTWAQIRELEEIATRERRRESLDRMMQLWFPERADHLRPCGGETGKDPSPDCGLVRDDNEGEGSPSSGADAPPSPQGEGLTPVSESDRPMTEGDGELEPTPARKPEKSRAEAGQRAMATRKQNILAALRHAREDGVAMQTVADQVSGLTINSVMDVLDAKNLPLPVWTSIEKAMKKLGYLPAAESSEE